MLVYWVVFAFFAIGALMASARRPVVVAQSGRAAEATTKSPMPRHRPVLALGALAIAVLVGMRYEIGSDWPAYEWMFNRAGRVGLAATLSLRDPGYQFFNWFGQQVGAGIWFVNLICGLLFTWGLLRFARTQPDPWLAMLVAVPYLVVVVAMGYSRQAVAIGILMAGLASMDRGASILRYSLYVLVAALFHATAVVGILLVVFAGQRNRLLSMIAGLAAFVLLFDLFLDDSADVYYERYVEQQYTSEGAAIRVAMTLLPAILFLVTSNRLGFTERQKAIWRNFALAAFGCLALLLVLPSTTAVDRLALYVTPLQVAVLSRIPGTLMRPGLGRAIVVSYSFAILFAWLNFASHASAWLPYRFYPFD